MLKTKLTDLQKQTLRGIKSRLQEDEYYMISNDNNNIYLELTYNIRIIFSCEWSIYDNIKLSGEVVYYDGYSINSKYIMDINAFYIHGYDTIYDKYSYDSECGLTMEEDEEYHYAYIKEGQDGFGNYLESISYDMRRQGNTVFNDIIETIDNMLMEG